MDNYEDIDDEPLEDEDEIDRGDDVVDEDEDLDNDENIDEDSDEDSDSNEDAGESDEGNEDEDEEDDGVSNTIPLSRLNEVISQRDEKADRIDWLENQLEALINKETVPEVKETTLEPIYNFTEAEEAYGNLLIEGETGKAAILRATIDSERKKELVALINEVKKTSNQEATDTSNALIETNKFDNLVTNFENKYPFLDADSDKYNEEAVETVNTLIAGYTASGKTKSQALSVAIKKAIPMYKPTEPDKTTLGNKRKTKARKKAADASNQQPTKTNSKGLKNIDTDTVDISKMSERDYNKLTAKEKRILRGD